MVTADSETVEAILASADRRRAERAASMPDERAAIDALFSAYQRLRELGWSEGIYAPKNGTVFDTIDVGSTGIHACYYSGEWPEGHWNTMDGGDVWPSSSAPALHRSRKPLTSDH